MDSVLYSDSVASVRKGKYMAKDGAGSASSLEKGLRILTCIGTNGECGLADVVRRTGYPKSTLLRLIQTMVKAGYLERTRHGRYRVTFNVWLIGAGTLEYWGVRERIRPVLEDLVRVTGETAHYSIYQDGHAVYLDKIDGFHPVRAYTRIGGRSPAFASATGKALLAWQEEYEIRNVIGRASQLTAETICEPEEFIRHAAEIRQLGYAVNRGEWRTGVWGIAAPIRREESSVEGAIGISGPEDRIVVNLEGYVSEVVGRAEALSQRL